MTKPVATEILTDLKALSEATLAEKVVITREQLRQLLATIYQDRDVMRTALDYVEGTGRKSDPSKVLTRAVLREGLGMEE